MNLAKIKETIEEIRDVWLFDPEDPDHKYSEQDIVDFTNEIIAQLSLLKPWWKFWK